MCIRCSCRKAEICASRMHNSEMPRIILSLSPRAPSAKSLISLIIKRSKNVTAIMFDISRARSRGQVARRETRNLREFSFSFFF